MTCDVCKKEFATQDELNAHKSTAHKNTDAAPDREHRFWRRKGE